MAIKFVWDPSYSVHNSEVDDQHNQLFERINDLPQQLDETRIKNTIIELFRYTRYHFTDEENMLAEMSYPKLDAHKQLHEELISKLNTISNQSFDSDSAIAEFRNFVFDWLISHIMTHDMEYARFAKQQQVTGFNE